MYVVTNQAINVLVSNIASHSVPIPKCMLIARGAGFPHQVLNVTRMFHMKTSDHQDATVNRVHYKQSIPSEIYRANAGDVDRNNEQCKEDDRKTAIKIPDEFETE